MRTRRLGILALALALGVTTLLAGCDSKGDGGVKTYKDSVYDFSFDYPADWETKRSESAGVTVGADPVAVVTVADPKGTRVGNTGVDLFMVRVYKLNAVVDESNLPEVLPFLEQLVTGLQSEDPTLKVEEPLTKTSLGGMPGYQFTSTFDWDADTPMKTKSYFVFAGDMEYQLIVQAATDTWTADQAVFDAFLSSFKPGKSTN